MPGSSWLDMWMLGVAANIILLLVSAACYLLGAWFIASPIRSRNLSKISPKKKSIKWYSQVKAFYEDSLVWRWIIFIQCLLSWLFFIYLIFNIVKGITLAFVARIPERVKEINYALNHNPNMTPESVWVHFVSYGVAWGGEPPSAEVLIDLIKEIKPIQPSFRSVVALEHLKLRGVTSAEDVDRAISYFKKLDEDRLNAYARLKADLNL